MNDKMMIENAGIGIAMGESNPRIKEIADYITEDNDNNGVKLAIERYCQHYEKIRKNFIYKKLNVNTFMFQN